MEFQFGKQREKRDIAACFNSYFFGAFSGRVERSVAICLRNLQTGSMPLSIRLFAFAEVCVL